MRVGPDLLRVVSAALALRRRTDGRFDPTVGRAVRAGGYDRTFRELRDDPRPAHGALPAGGTVALDAGAGWIALGEGVDLDLGAIAKGDAADRACALMAGAGPCLVSAGGDLAVSGPRPDGPWAVAIATADGPLTLALERGGLATSGTDRRWWSRGGRVAHHAIDPRRGRSAATDLVRATAVAATAAEADARATALLVAGSGAGGRLADRWGVPAALVGEDGGLVLAGGLS
jgi:thiamine biosynthesis lipoprotein